ncbi:oxidoreductase [Pseudolabrys sp. Root1462]|uniref:SDR family NAD(P)-dependent oxidoreductase n=1 Tax=Pseudolabrys sp. Root1462 TaxID=1736466 RepID=UPI00070352CB|nr:SDR family oxidoreductase [Pseudolabrys sp. Root1462]KQZ01908.1 oxidoreductase [Pseudolabrys sp. Root1462]
MSGGQAVVIGGTKGLGREIAGRFLARGQKVTLVSRSRPNHLVDGTQPVHVAADLESLTDARDIVSEVVEANGPVQYLIFSQRYRGGGDPWAGELQVGLNATRLLVEAFTNRFISEGDRAIGIVSSVYADFVGGSQPVGYHLVKAGLNQLARYYAWELGRQGIRVNAVMPLSYVKNESRPFYAAQTELTDLYKRFVPLGRMGDSVDAANLLDFLCSEKAGFINGQCIFVDGGVSVVWQEEVAKSLTGL